jgi:hypothetical protein
MTNEWQSIASAPKDGTHLMLYGEAYGYRAWMRGSYRSFADGSAGWITNIIYTEPDEWRGSGPPPTHWMPLPPAPPKDDK